jgi:ABC-type uncharacterized transport system permease subunit
MGGGVSMLMGVFMSVFMSMLMGVLMIMIRKEQGFTGIGVVIMISVLVVMIVSMLVMMIVIMFLDKLGVFGRLALAASAILAHNGFLRGSCLCPPLAFHCHLPIRGNSMNIPNPDPRSGMRTCS